jgi:hypothetical protein
MVAPIVDEPQILPEEISSESKFFRGILLAAPISGVLWVLILLLIL